MKFNRINEPKPIFFFLFFIIFILSSDNTRRCSSAESGHAHTQPISNHEDQELTLSGRGLSRLGSSPPNCDSKCGSCTPCTTVLVSVPSGPSGVGDDFPKVWRCKCGNKLYMP
ncbi:EPIDERMAL PATTERNING FACTOR-like protein 6, partial [Cucurbita argyrosperma subsp. sororia]